MKKILYGLTSIGVIVALMISCTKESGIIVTEDNSNAAVNSDIDSKINSDIPTEIIAEINPDDVSTKTQYAGNTTFGWTQDDQVRLPVIYTGTGSNYNKTNSNTYKTSDASGSTTATFSSLETETGAWANYRSLGYAIYPSSIYGANNSWYNSGEWDDGNGHPVVNLPTSYTYNEENPLNSGFGVTVPLIGRKDGDKFKFSTAVGILKVTIAGFPASATKVQLTSSANNIAGKFAISDVSSTVSQISNTAYSGGTGTITLNVSDLTEGVSHDFYFPVPVGTYAAKVLSIKVLDSSGILIAKDINKAITISRNEVLALPEMSSSTSNTISFDLSQGADNPRVKWKYNCGGIRLAITKSATPSPSDLKTNGNRWNYDTAHNNGMNLTGIYNKDDDNKYLETNGSGKYYLHWFFVKDINTAISSLDDDVIISYNHQEFYYIKSSTGTMLASLLPDWTQGVSAQGYPNGNVYVKSGSFYAVKTKPMFAVSDDPTRGNVKLINFIGMSYDISENALWTLDSNYKDGNPVYGVFDFANKKLTLDYDLERPFYTDLNDYLHYLGATTQNYSTASSYSKSIIFTINGEYSSSTYPLVSQYDWVGEQWKQDSGFGITCRVSYLRLGDSGSSFSE